MDIRLSLRRLDRTLTLSTATAAALPLAEPLRVAGRSRLLRLLLLGWTLTLTLLLRLLRLPLRRLVALLSALLLSALLRLRRALFLAARLAGPLLELADLFLHEPPRLRILLRAQLIVAAIRAALPSFRIGFPAGGTENAFRERHREIGAHCTLRTVDESRRLTLLALIHLAEESSPSACWDDRRALELLRKEATADELRELGAEERLIAHIYAEEHAR